MAAQPDTSADSPLLDRLKRMGITQWYETLLCLPKTFMDYSKVSTLKQALPQDTIIGAASLFSLVVTEPAVIVPQPKKRLCLSATDGQLSVKIVLFIVPGVDVDTWKNLGAGTHIHLRGTLQNWGGRLQMTGPTLIDSTLIGRVLPVYEKRRGIVAEGAIYDATRHALLEHLAESVQEIVGSFHGRTEDQIIARAGVAFASLADILCAAHAPKDESEGIAGQAAMRKLAALSIVENARRLKVRAPLPSSALTISGALIDKLTAALPYPLPRDQRTAIDEIITDIASPFPMRRCLSGDVGSGKTICIMIPALATQRLGERAVILTPNALLAEQFVKECQSTYPGTNIFAVTAATTKKLDLSGNPILVGTTALLARLKGQKPPAFLAVDEEQKLSVGQKAELSGIESNYLQATATPIPRTTALISHGGFDVSLIREMPVKKTIVSHVVSAAEARRLFEHTRKVLDSGGQVAIVYPIVKDEEQAKKSVVAAFNDWNARFPGFVAMVHGQMKEAEKMEVVSRLKRGEQKIAIVSSVIEIGLTLPSLRSLIVVNAERYGTSTLHQLRGRVARHGGTGYFFMFLPEPVSQDTRYRLNLLVAHSDGFVLSEKDAELRGYGDLFEDSERQSGTSRSSVFRCIELTPAEIHAASCT